MLTKLSQWSSEGLTKVTFGDCWNSIFYTAGFTFQW